MKTITVFVCFWPYSCSLNDTESLKTVALSVNYVHGLICALKSNHFTYFIPLNKGLVVPT